MTELLTAAQMRAIERAAIDSEKVTGLALMELAGRGVVAAVFAEWPDLSRGAHHAVVLCGPGNNGGDGFVIARRLRDKGWQVDVLFHGDPAKLPADARRNHDIWQSMGAVKELTPEAAAKGARPALLVDAMFGTGLRGAIPLSLALAHHAVRDRDANKDAPNLRCVAVECLSGLDCDSGQILMPPKPAAPNEGAEEETHWQWWAEDASKRLLRCDLTVSFHRKKIGHVLGHFPTKTVVVDIGLGAEDRHPAHLMRPRTPDRVVALDFDPPRGRSRRIWPFHSLDKRQGAHKFEHGHALILSGGPGTTGAARLAARGALRIGAGLVTLGVPPSAQQEVACQITALMLARVPDAAALSEKLQAGRITALCIGPGLGLARVRDLVPAALAQVEDSKDGSMTHPTRGVVLDADALSAYADAPGALFGMLHEGCVLTPHGGEFSRLFPDIAARLKDLPTAGPAFSKVDATRAAAQRAGCVVVLKGADTVIAAPDGRCSINAAVGGRKAPWLATAGAGDVLAGFITGLLARGLPPIEAAEIAAWLHVECARAFGPGLIAEDLPDILPQVLREIASVENDAAQES